MGIFDLFKDKRTVISYQDHAGLYYGTLHDCIDKKFKEIQGYLFVQSSKNPEVIKREMIALTFALDVKEIIRIFNKEQTEALLTTMTKIFVQNIDGNAKKDFLDVVSMYNKEMSKYDYKTSAPLVHCIKVFRDRCSLNGSDDIDWELAQTISTCRTNWDGIKKNFRFTDDSQMSTNTEHQNRDVKSKANISREQVISKLYGDRLNNTQMTEIFAEFDRWNRTKGDPAALATKMIQISQGRLDYRETQVIINLLTIDGNSGLDHMMAQLGAGTMGTALDEIPEGFGAFGHEATNPIPTKGIGGSEEYLNSLSLTNGSKIKWRRVGSLSVDNINNPIDIYLVLDANTGQELAKLFLSPYNKRTSAKPPVGFNLAGR